MLPSFWICSRYSKISQEKILTSDSQVLFPNFPSLAVVLQAWAVCQQNFSLLVSQVHCAARAAKSAQGKVFGADITTACGKAVSQTRCWPQPSATYCANKRIVMSHPCPWDSTWDKSSLSRKDKQNSGLEHLCLNIPDCPCHLLGFIKSLLSFQQEKLKFQTPSVVEDCYMRCAW